MAVFSEPTASVGPPARIRSTRRRSHESARRSCALCRRRRHGQPPSRRRPRYARVGRMARARARARRCDPRVRRSYRPAFCRRPRLPYVTRAHFDAGLVISASHNPYQDNGIKVFSGAGEKFGEALEAKIEGIVADTSWTVDHGDDAALERVRFRRRVHRPCARGAAGSRRRLGSMGIVLDLANGATTTVAPRLFGALGFRRNGHWQRAGRAQHQSASAGRRIPAGRLTLVRKGGYSLGVAFDGDGDRAIFALGRWPDRRRRRGPAHVREADEAARARSPATPSSRP